MTAFPKNDDISDAVLSLHIIDFFHEHISYFYVAEHDVGMQLGICQQLLVKIIDKKNLIQGFSRLLVKIQGFQGFEIK